MRRQFVAIFMFVLVVACRRHGPTGEIARVQELKAGMTGYCLSEYEDGMDRLEFKIIGVQPEEERVGIKIAARFTSQSHSLAGRGVPSGMSGSPLYLNDGRLIGALAQSPDDDGYLFWATPIQDMLDQARHITPSGSTGGSQPPESGSLIALCTVWGDATSCAYPTVTVVKGNLVFATGHFVQDLSDVPSREAAAFEVPVLTTVQAADPVRLGGPLGRPLGTMVYNGAHGSIIDLRRAVDEFPITLSLYGTDTAPRHLLAARINLASPDDITAGLKAFIVQGMDTSRSLRAEIKVILGGSRGTLVIRDDWEVALASAQEFLMLLLQQSPHDLDSVEVNVAPADEQDSYSLLRLEVGNYGGASPQVKVSVTRKSDNQRLRTYEQFVKPTGDLQTMAWYDGRAFQKEVLALMPAVDAVSVLNQISNRESLYLACLECEQPPEQANRGSEFVPVLPSVRVLWHLPVRGWRLTAPGPVPLEIHEEAKQK